MEKRKFVSLNPANLDVLGEVYATSHYKLEEMVEKARKAFIKWRKISFKERGRYLKKISDSILKSKEELAKLITLEMGRPLFESIGEVNKAASFYTFFAENAEAFLEAEQITLTSHPQKTAVLIHEPVGVVAAIEPWNLPLQTPTRAIAPALMAGCTVILKPSEYTPLVAIELNKIISQSGIPDGVFQLAVGDKETGQDLVNSNIDMVSFTGSVRAGKNVALSCAERLKKVSLELGGKDAMIVCESVDLDFASEAIIWGSLTNCGQLCSSVERVYVSEKIYSQIIDLVVEITKNIRVGNGLEQNIDVGPLANEQQLKTVIEQVEEAKRKGAQVLFGGEKYDSGELSHGYFYMPTVLVDVDHEMKVMTEETFGPVIAIMPYRSIEEAIELANDSDFGLGASIFSQNEEEAQEIARNLNVGMVWINEPLMSFPQAPWSVRKDSGCGAASGRAGLLEFTLPKLINWQFSENVEPRPWWYPYQTK